MGIRNLEFGACNQFLILVMLNPNPINVKSVLESVGLTAPMTGEQYWRIPQDIGARALKVQLDTNPYLQLNVMITG